MGARRGAPPRRALRAGCPPLTDLHSLRPRDDGEEARDLFTADTLADPYAAYAAVRAADPVTWSEQLGAWVLPRYADVTAVLRDERFSSTLAGADPDPAPDSAGPEDPGPSSRRRSSS